MSDAPTSADSGEAAETPDPLALIDAGWRPEELGWERLQERALACAAAGNAAEAASLWAEALRLARAHFADNDPRLATSLCNHAVGLSQGGDASAARRLVDEALRIWDASGPWVEALKPERRARSSTFHLRLQAKHPGGYDHFSHSRYAALAAEGRDAILGCREQPDCDAESTAARLSHWRKDRPAGFTDGRKLMAAVRLMPAL